MFGRNNLRYRNSWLQRVLAELRPGSTLLDAGAGEGANRSMYQHLSATTQDICEYDGSGDGQGLHTGMWDTSDIDIVSPIEDMPIEDGSFDTVLCTEVLEHLPNAEVAIRELVRVTKPGGLLIITAPFASMVHFAPHFYATGFSRYFYEHCFKKYGCDIVEIDANGDWFEMQAQELMRLPKMGGSVFESAVCVVAFFLALPLVPVLAFLSKNSDGNTSNAMCFGLHVLAKKRAR